MRVAVYTLTRERLEYTQRTFASLRAKAGIPFDHYIVDNGSKDGTVDWLRAHESEFKAVIYNPENVGIAVASNQAIDRIKADGPCLVCKCDNDCEVESENILGQMVEIFSARLPYGPRYILSPRVEGIVNQPERVRYTQIAGRRVGICGMIGGLFQLATHELAFPFRYDPTLPKARGHDSSFCAWARTHGAECGYVEGLVVRHMDTTDGQAKKYPDYFVRKHHEEINP